ncbi:MAG: putative 7-carboxy-7-deazaguanine synthase QueE, partial [Ruminococcus sp.]|nr:putative 7-carboxy-7-deazaguanine synthase QueE [Ruminococcus sp.]
MLEVVEKFISINGEGAHAGEMAAFIRFKGCNLRCSYCDTQWANLPDALSRMYEPEELLKWVEKACVRNVTLTGGEPLLQADIALLIALLTERGYRVEIETNGSIALDTFAKMPRRPVFTMDYKLPDSGMEAKMRLDNFQLLQPHDSVKFVAGSQTDLAVAEKIIQEFHLTNKCRVFLSPVFGKINPADI